ncbi:MAG: hypothetical protein RL701_1940, partial [Pseudomonadota bacterium]
MRIRPSKKAVLASLGLLHGCAQDVTENEAAGVAEQTAALSTSTPSYLQPLARGVTFTPLISVGDSVNKKPDGVTPYRFVGIPDGLGAYDNGDDTFTVLVNHELGNTAGIARAHGGKGSFVSKWTFNKNTLQAVRGEDLIQAVSTYNTASGTWNPPVSGVSFARFCSADLQDKDAFFNKDSKKGFKGQIFMNGEEAGDEGRALAHVVSGDATGITYELPHLGKFSHENSVANPGTGDKTLVGGTDDTGNGQVYFYLGDKSKTGNVVQKAGLAGGVLYGLKITDVVSESDATALAPGHIFTLVSLGNVANLTGAQLQAQSVAAGVTGFQRPEDAAWNEADPSEFYFATTASMNNKTRIWRLRFNDILNPSAGGTVDLISDGGEPRMIDNIGIERKGRFAIGQEDPGGNDHLAKVWRYEIDEPGHVALPTVIGQFDPDRFAPGAARFLTNDEESSGVIDVSKILGNGYYLLDAQ